MQIDKQQILTMLQGRGKHDQVTQADAELPDQVDTNQHASILDKLGINIGDLLGGGGRGGIAGTLGL